MSSLNLASRCPLWYTGIVLNEVLVMLLPRLHKVLLSVSRVEMKIHVLFIAVEHNHEGNFFIC